ncbi:MAG: 3-deoxy-manno-octulosonate cytidylyltransferase [Saprospiraceae bacterium]|nr:3-deoxy-manno-octulosonate cytidylyltransferase [Saprospiraceae bacterium]MDP4813797.1 3-deoxy-manno-octulosonate cytidylyltransferase [Saprospiraceae bacterium]MDP5048013.1 3-deoxy-manno-octulosonate cytidylyltransferase [Saprospiraceae bacterium]
MNETKVFRMKKNIVIIPARYKSIRFPGKPLAKISQKSMIQYIYDSIKNYSFLDEIIVATDDQRIVNHCIEMSIPFALTNENHQSGTDRVAEVAKKYPASFNIINLQGDEPFIKESDIKKLIETLNSAKDGIATLACLITDKTQKLNPNRVKVVFNKKKEAMYFSRFDIPFQKSDFSDALTYQHIGIYGFKNKVLQTISNLPPGLYEKAESLEQLRWLEEGLTVNLGFVEEALFSIDTPEDLKEANRKVNNEYE